MGPCFPLVPTAACLSVTRHSLSVLHGVPSVRERIPPIGTLRSAAKMPNDELLTDDYVADLLAKDARDCSLKYSTMGMEAYTSSRKYVLHNANNSSLGLVT